MGELGFIQKLGAPGKSGGWQVFGTLVVGSGSSGQNIHAQADFPKAGYYTIEFSIDVPASGQFDAVAEVVWSVEGNDVRRFISVGSGTTISGTGAGVKVKVYDRSGSTFTGFFGTEYKASLLISPGTRPSEEKPPTLVAETATGLTFIQVTPGSSTTIAIPRNAGVTSVNVVAFAGVVLDPTSCSVFLSASTPMKEYFPSEPDQWVPVPPNANSVILNNNFPALGPNINFFVTFGIEG
jgi:hypothetical protein